MEHVKVPGGLVPRLPSPKPRRERNANANAAATSAQRERSRSPRHSAHGPVPGRKEDEAPTPVPPAAMSAVPAVPVPFEAVPSNTVALFVEGFREDALDGWYRRRDQVVITGSPAFFSGGQGSPKLFMYKQASGRWVISPVRSGKGGEEDLLRAARQGEDRGVACQKAARGSFSSWREFYQGRWVEVKLNVEMFNFEQYEREKRRSQTNRNGRDDRSAREERPVAPPAVAASLALPTAQPQPPAPVAPLPSKPERSAEAEKPRAERLPPRTTEITEKEVQKMLLAAQAETKQRERIEQLEQQKEEQLMTQQAKQKAKPPKEGRTSSLLAAAAKLHAPPEAGFMSSAMREREAMREISTEASASMASATPKEVPKANLKAVPQAPRPTSRSAPVVPAHGPGTWTDLNLPAKASLLHSLAPPPPGHPGPPAPPVGDWRASAFGQSSSMPMPAWQAPPSAMAAGFVPLYGMAPPPPPPPPPPPEVRSSAPVTPPKSRPQQPIMPLQAQPMPPPQHPQKAQPPQPAQPAQPTQPAQPAQPAQPRSVAEERLENKVDKVGSHQADEAAVLPMPRQPGRPKAKERSPESERVRSFLQRLNDGQRKSQEEQAGKSQAKTWNHWENASGAGAVAAPSVGNAGAGAGAALNAAANVQGQWSPNSWQDWSTWDNWHWGNWSGGYWQGGNWREKVKKKDKKEEKKEKKEKKKKETKEKAKASPPKDVASGSTASSSIPKTGPPGDATTTAPQAPGPPGAPQPGGPAASTASSASSAEVAAPRRAPLSKEEVAARWKQLLEEGPKEAAPPVAPPPSDGAAVTKAVEVIVVGEDEAGHREQGAVKQEKSSEEFLAELRKMVMEAKAKEKEQKEKEEKEAPSAGDLAASKHQSFPATVEGFYGFMVERERIRLRRQRGDAWPWTVDPILRHLRVRNLHRSHDRSHVLMQRLVNSRPMRLDAMDASFEECLWNVCLWRRFGSLHFIDKLGFVPVAASDKDIPDLVQVATDLWRSGLHACTDAYGPASRCHSLELSAWHPDPTAMASAALDAPSHRAKRRRMSVTEDGLRKVQKAYRQLWNPKIASELRTQCKAVVKAIFTASKDEHANSIAQRVLSAIPTHGVSDGVYVAELLQEFYNLRGLVMGQQVLVPLDLPSKRCLRRITKGDGQDPPYQLLTSLHDQQKGLWPSKIEEQETSELRLEDLRPLVAEFDRYLRAAEGKPTRMPFTPMM